MPFEAEQNSIMVGLYCRHTINCPLLSLSPAAEILTINIPLIVVGGHRNVESLEEIKNRGRIDFFLLSRPLISEPDLPNRWLEGRLLEVGVGQFSTLALYWRVRPSGGCFRSD